MKGESSIHANCAREASDRCINASPLLAVSLNPRAALLGFLDRFATDARCVGLSDQELAEFMLEVGARWLAAHGVSATNVHLWIDRALAKPAPVPLSAAARERNDFGARR